MRAEPGGSRRVGPVSTGPQTQCFFWRGARPGFTGEYNYRVDRTQRLSTQLAAAGEGEQQTKYARGGWRGKPTGSPRSVAGMVDVRASAPASDELPRFATPELHIAAKVQHVGTVGAPVTALPSVVVYADETWRFRA